MVIEATSKSSIRLDVLYVSSIKANKEQGEVQHVDLDAARSRMLAGGDPFVQHLQVERSGRYWRRSTELPEATKVVAEHN